MRNTQSKPFRLATATDWKRIREIADRKDIVLNLQNSISYNNHCFREQFTYIKVSKKYPSYLELLQVINESLADGHQSFLGPFMEPVNSGAVSYSRELTTPHTQSGAHG